MTLGNVGNGSLAHLTTIVLNQAAGAKFVPVAYKGGGPLSTDVMGGHVELAMASTAAQAQHVRGGKMRALVLTGDKRSHTMPDVPTLKELGIDVVAHAWWGILAPAGTPKPIIDKLVRRAEQGDRAARREQDAHRNPGHGGRRARPRRDAEVDRRQHRALGQGGEGQQHQGGMKLAILDDYQRVALEYADWKSLKGVEVTVFEPNR